MIDLWICEDWPKCPHFPNMSSLCWLKTRSSVCSKYKKTRTHTTVRKWHFNEKDAEVSPQPYLICHMQLDETQQTHIHTHTLLPHLLTAGTLVLLTLDSTTLSLSLSTHSVYTHTHTLSVAPGMIYAGLLSCLNDLDWTLDLTLIRSLSSDNVIGNV